MKRIIISSLIIPTIPSLAATADSSVNTVEMEFRQLERDIPSLYLLNGLFLSSDQAKALADALKEVWSLNSQTRADMERFLQQHQADYPSLLEEAVNREKAGDKGPGRHTRDITRPRQTRREWTALMAQKEEAINALAKKALNILTPAQSDIVNRFVPCFIPPQDFRNPERVGQAAEDTSLGEKILARLREAPDKRREQGREKALDLLVPYVMKERHAELTDEEIQRLREKLGKDLDRMVERIRTMNDADFELEKSKLVQQVLKLDRNHSMVIDSKAALNKANVYLLNPGNLDVLKRRAGEAPLGVQTDSAQLLLRNELLEKGRPFKAATLIADLHVTAGQAEQMLPLVRDAVAARMRLDQQMQQLMSEAIRPYQTLKKGLMEQQPSQQAETAAAQYHHKVKVLYDENWVKELLKYEAQVDRILSADQVAFLMGKKDGRNRGTATNARTKETITEVRRRAEAVLDTIGKMNMTDFAKTKHELCERFVISCLDDRLIDRDDINADSETARAEQVLERARRMNPVEYRRARANLVAEICPRRHQPRPATYSWKMVDGDHLETLNPTTHLLFSQAALTILEKKTGVTQKGR